MSVTPPLNIPDLDQVERQLAEASAVADGNGARYVRASVACRIIGIAPSLGNYWARKGLVRSFKAKVPSRPGAVRGELVAWRVDDAAEQARRYWSGGRQWSAAEEDHLLTRLGVVPTQRIAQELRRTVNSVRRRATELGVNARSAQGELTTTQLADLAGVSYCAVLGWCDRSSPRLRHRRMPDRLRCRMIDPDGLGEFFRRHPAKFDRLSRAAQQRIERLTMPLHQRRKAVAA